MSTNTKSVIVRRVATVALFPVALLVGIGIGSSGGDTPPETITKTETVTETVEVERTPEACLAALDYADEVQGHAGDGFLFAADAIDAAANFDIAALEAANLGLSKVATPLEVAMADYQDAAATCRAEGI